MSKKLITACMALVAFAAFALPAVASASPQITHPTGTRLDPKAAGAECTGVKETICVTATNVGETFFNNDPAEGTKPSTLARCTKAVMTGYLTKNSGTAVEATIHTATFSGSGSEFEGMPECTGTFGNLTPTTNGGGVDENTVAKGTPWCIRANNEMASDEFQIRGGACSEAAREITFILATTIFGGSTNCAYSRPAAEPIKGTFTTHATGDAILTVKTGETTTERKRTTFTGEAGNSFLCPSTGTLEMSLTLETDTVATEPLYIS